MTRKANQPFVRNAWYIAAWSEEIEAGLLARTIMDQPIVIYRDAKGDVGALEDRCCHRGAPLTHGHIIDQGLQCGYHGLTFDTKGDCVMVPGQKNIPPQAQVRHFPLVERNQILWIWMGDPALADESQIVDYPYHDDSVKWPHRKAMFQINSNYMLMIDNLMDLTHLGYVHGSTIGGDPNQHVAADMETRQTENGAYFIRWMMDHEPPPTYKKGGQFEGKVDRWQEFEYVGPSIVLQWSGALKAGDGAREDRTKEGFHLRLLHAATPETETTFHYFWSSANGYRQSDPAATQEMYDEIYPTFIEDKVIMEAQQERINLNPDRDLVEIHADSALSLARLSLDNLIADDQSHMAQAAE
ncbi:MAG: aromatic ring-hydroxylating dioxygenase subunit alpha [Pseudomonadota bacterium]|nr:aromatic ring-hydroxylating dioxygenase subunit alpha [Pseudomonadota bacterium]